LETQSHPVDLEKLVESVDSNAKAIKNLEKLPDVLTSITNELKSLRESFNGQQSAAQQYDIENEMGSFEEDVDPFDFRNDRTARSASISEGIYKC